MHSRSGNEVIHRCNRLAVRNTIKSLTDLHVPLRAQHRRRPLPFCIHVVNSGDAHRYPLRT